MMTNAEQGPVLIMAGGTGGHLFPALAVADELRARGVQVSWLGTQRGLEARVVPAAGYPLETVRVSGLRGKGALRLLAAPFMLARALWQAGRIEWRLRPRAVLGMGGFASGPGGVMAWLLRRPLLIHEQNSVAGTTNRLLAPLARTVMVAFPGSLPAARKPIHTGNPVRGRITALPAPATRLADHSGPLRLLVVGGSLGARALNDTVPAALARLPANNTLLRVLQYLDVDLYPCRLCWNGDCDNCRFVFADPDSGEEVSAKGCGTLVCEGMAVRSLPARAVWPASFAGLEEG